MAEESKTFIIFCTECDAGITISDENLIKNKGFLLCPECLKIFDASHYLKVSAPKKSEYFAKAFPWEKTFKSLTPIWKLGVILGCVLLFGQLVYLKRALLLENQTLRPKLEKLCETLSCSLPRYVNIQQLKIINSSFDFSPTKGYIFKIVFANEADYSQGYPKVKLTLLNASAEPFAERIFLPKDYEQAGNKTIAPKTSATVILHLAALNTVIGGYYTDFVP